MTMWDDSKHDEVSAKLAAESIASKADPTTGGSGECWFGTEQVNLRAPYYVLLDDKGVVCRMKESEFPDRKACDLWAEENKLVAKFMEDIPPEEEPPKDIDPDK